MDILKPVKSNQGLLTGTALLCLVSVVAGACGANPVLGLITNVTAGLAGDNFGKFAERCGESGGVLRNQDLARAAGRTIGWTLLEKVSPDYPDMKKQLDKLAKKIEDYWLAWEKQQELEENFNLFEALHEDQLVQIFSQQPDQFTEYQVLESSEWQAVVRWLFEQGCQDKILKSDLVEYDQVMGALAGELESHFNQNLRSVLKDDANNGGKAFAGMLLDLHGATIAKIEEIQQYLPQLATHGDMRRVLAAISQLQRPSQPASTQTWHGLGAINTVPKLPNHFLPRSEDIVVLKEKLLTPTTQTLVMTGQVQKVGLQGMGGLGKTVLAAALARDNDVRKQFRDGIIWLTVGIKPDRIGLYQSIAETLGETYAYQEGEYQWKAYLSNLLREKSCLLVLDDVWEQAEAERFVEVLGSDCRLLLTTRDARLINGLGANGYQLGILDDTQARQLLANWVGVHVEMLPAEGEAVREHCGNLPLALELAGAQIAMGTSWQDLVTALDAADLRFLDQSDRSIYKVLDTSVAQLAEPLRQAYLKLGIVAPDVEVSEFALVKLWGRQGNIPEYQLRQWLTELAQRGLVFVAGESPERWMSLHDVPQKYLEEKLADKAVLHRHWLESYGGGRFPWTGAEVAGDLYLYRQAIYHFQGAGEIEAFRQLLLDFDWLQGKLDATNIREVLADFEMVTGGEDRHSPLKLIEGALRLSAHVLDQDKNQLASQLWGRLLYFVNSRQPYQYFWEKIPVIRRYLPQYETAKSIKGDQQKYSAEIERLLNHAKQAQKKPWLRPFLPCFDSPDGALIRTLTGHSGSVNAVAVTGDGKIISGSADKTVKVWDIHSGNLLHTLTGHSDPVNAVAVTGDGKVISGSWDETVKVWDIHSGNLLHTLTNHGDFVLAVAVTGDGKVISGSRDKTVKVWNIHSGNLLHTLTGHSDSVTAVAVTEDGQIISGSYDKTVKVWDIHSGNLLYTLTGYSEGVLSVAVTGDGQIISGSDDKTVKVWDIHSGNLLYTLTGHSNRVWAVAVTEDGKVISGSDDKTVKVWDIHSGNLLYTLTGHSGDVNAVAVTGDGKVISGSRDETVKVWDIHSGKSLHTLTTGHSNMVTAIAVTEDSKVISGSLDHTVKVWDIHSGNLLHTLTGHSHWVWAVAVTGDGKVISGSSDNTVKVWDIHSGNLLHTLTGHSGNVRAVAVRGDGKVISGSKDETVKVWDIHSGNLLHTLTGHNDGVSSVAVTGDGKIISGSYDKTVKVWDIHSGNLLHTLTGHSDWVKAVAVTGDGKVISGSHDHTVKVWDIHSGNLLHTLTGHSHLVHAVAVTGDGKVISGSHDHTVKLWDMETGEILINFMADANIFCCAVSNDCKTVIAGDYIGRLLFLGLEGF
jgi:WD40 repeat protein